MSRSLSIRGIRGGAGGTALLAGLGHALARLGERVLLVDMCPDNQLGLHFNLPVDEALGWARAEIDGNDWRDCAYTPFKGLVLLPYGLIDEEQAVEIERRLMPWPGIVLRQLEEYANDHDWLLFDLPQGRPGHLASVEGGGGCDLKLRVANVDPGCHVRLQRMAGQPDGMRLLANRYDPSIQLQRNLMQVWLHHYPRELLPITVHEDVAVPEALAMKLPLGLHAPDALAASDIESLAVWCQTEAGRLATVVDRP